MDRELDKRTAAAGNHPAAAFSYDEVTARNSAVTPSTDAHGALPTTPNTDANDALSVILSGGAPAPESKDLPRPQPQDAPSLVTTPVAPQPNAADVLDRDFSATDPRDEQGRIACWTVRGCAGIWGPTGNYMELDCPHNEPDRYSPCPQSCAYTRCQRPWHAEATSFEDLLDPTVDRMRAIKEQCRHCLHFIRFGPRVGE